MLPLSASSLLTLWEQGEAQSSVRQALLLLAAFCPDMPPEDLAKLSIGRRDGILLKLRDQLFGSHLVSVARCPACGDRLQLTFNVSDVRTVTGEKQAEPLTVRLDGFVVCFRLTDSNDQASIAECDDITVGRRLLLRRCLLEVRRNGEEQPAEQVSEKILEAVSEKMAQADPQADVQLDLTCPACSHAWSAAFDIVSYFWQEIDSWAQRILRDIHLLASAYGWREADILNMSARRRQFYLEMIGVRV
jgi:uncharacterized protein (UPF0212 family)